MARPGTLLMNGGTTPGASAIGVPALPGPSPWRDAEQRPIATDQPTSRRERRKRRRLKLRERQEDSRGTRPSTVRDEESLVEKAIILAHSPLFWLWVATAMRNWEDGCRPGRKPKAPDYVKFLLVSVSNVNRSMLRTIRELRYPPIWNLVAEALNANLPEGWTPCPDTCPTASDMKYFNFRTGSQDSETHEAMHDTVVAESVRIARGVGILGPETQRSSRGPALSNCVVIDGTVVGKAHGGGVDDSTGPQIVFNDETPKNCPYGSKALYTWATNGESILLLSADPVPRDPTAHLEESLRSSTTP